jgi:hypothetical protein
MLSHKFAQAHLRLHEEAFSLAEALQGLLQPHRVRLHARFKWDGDITTIFFFLASS